MQTPDPAAVAAVTAGRLALGASLEVLSMTVALLALAGLVFAGTPARLACTLSLALAAGQFGYALRVRFDRQIFALWAARWRAPGARQDAHMAAFDGVIGRCGEQRGIQARAAGALRLFHRQAALLAAQALALGVAGALLNW